ncbi:MAG: hypothetical protein OXN94_13510 [Chloroflexota bacterium]|nr:hypothetical protein [Chloroflexota bacterium]
MKLNNDGLQRLQVLITVKTYPLPSRKYRELVCTAGVTANGDFVRLYPINFRKLDDEQQYKKYQWIEVNANKHSGRDFRKESFYPVVDSIRLGEYIPTRSGNWDTRAKYILAKKSQSMEELYDRQSVDQTSLGIFKPKTIDDLEITSTTGKWSTNQESALLQLGLWDSPKKRSKPLRKVPYSFHYRFKCDDVRCKRNHRMSIHDWEVGVLFWKLVDAGATPEKAAHAVKSKFLNRLCGGDRNTHFFVGTMLDYPSWIVLGLFSPKIGSLPLPFEF